MKKTCIIQTNHIHAVTDLQPNQNFIQSSICVYVERALMILKGM